MIPAYLAPLANHLTPAQLEAILAHEMCHVRRRDNLAAALPMWWKPCSGYRAQPGGPESRILAGAGHVGTVIDDARLAQAGDLRHLL